jgi:tetratricopeptide (TPR) repeat protein
MRSSIRSLAGLTVLLSLASGPSAPAAPDSGLDDRIRILQEAFTRFEKDRQDLQSALKAEQRARKDGEAALAKALKQVTDLEGRKEAAELRCEEAAQVIRGLESAREEAAQAVKEREKAIRRLETEVERLRALSASLESENRELKSRPLASEAEPVAAAEPAPVLPEPKPEPVAVIEAEEAPSVEPAPAPADREAPSLDSARKLMAAGRAEEAEAMLRGLANVRRPELEVLTELGRLQLKQNRYAEAAQTFQAAYRREPKNTAILKDLALACHGAKQLPEAIRYLNKVVQLDDKDGESHFNLAALYLMIPNPKTKDAAAHYEKALRMGEARDEKLEAILFK